MSQIQEARDDARDRRRTEIAAEGTGFVGGALALGALGPQGKGWIPAEVAGLDTDLLIGAGLWLLSRKKSGKRPAMMRGAAYAALAGGLRDLGSQLAAKF